MSKKLFGVVPVASVAGFAAVNGLYLVKNLSGQTWVGFCLSLVILGLYMSIAKAFYQALGLCGSANGQQ